MEDVNAQMKFYRIDRFVKMKERTYKDQIPSAVGNQFFLAARALETKLTDSTRQKLFLMNETHEFCGELLQSIVHILNDIEGQVDQFQSSATSRSSVQRANETFEELVARTDPPSYS